jgi:Integrase core domain
LRFPTEILPRSETSSYSTTSHVGARALGRRRFKTQAEARIAVFEFVEGFYNPRRRHSSIGYLSPIEYERRHAVNPNAHQPAAVLAAVKDKPSGRPRSGTALDRRCARRLHQRAGRDGRMAPPGVEQKNDTKQEGKMPSDQIP